MILPPMPVAPPYRRLSEEPRLARHQGIFRRQIGWWEGTALIVSGTIGAGILGLPYAVAPLGIPLGAASIVGLGLLMMAFNLLLGRVAISAGESLELPGLAGKFLGPLGKAVMAAISYLLLVGVLLVYIIGEGEALSGLFGGEPRVWSLAFFAAGSVFVTFGLQIVKTVEAILSIVVLAVILVLTAIAAPYFGWSQAGTFRLANLFLPYGVILFAFHSATSVPLAYSVLRNRERDFRRAIFASSVIVIIAYTLFTAAVVGVTGPQTTEIATMGLGFALGRPLFILGNVFAAFAMGTCFLLAATSLASSLSWDMKLSRSLSAALALGTPLLIFLLGAPGFVPVMAAVGGVLISLEMAGMLLVWLASCVRRRHIV